MGWLGSITWELIKHGSASAVGFESRTRRELRTVNRTGTRYVNGFPSGTFNYSVEVPFEYEDRREVVTRTVYNIYESVALITAAAAATLPASEGSGDAETDEYSTIVYDAIKSEPSGGWKCQKTETEVTITRGNWVTVSSTEADEVV
jgi:hypothetical protein